MTSNPTSNDSPLLFSLFKVTFWIFEYASPAFKLSLSMVIASNVTNPTSINVTLILLTNEVVITYSPSLLAEMDVPLKVTILTFLPSGQVISNVISVLTGAAVWDAVTLPPSSQVALIS